MTERNRSGTAVDIGSDGDKAFGQVMTRKGTGKRRSVRMEVEDVQLDDKSDGDELRKMKIRQSEVATGTIMCNPFEGKMAGFLAVLKEHSFSMYLGGKAVKHRWHECDHESFRWCRSYQEEGDNVWSNKIMMTDVTKVVPESHTTQFSGEDRFAFEIVTKGRTFTVAANSDAERENWVIALQAAIDANDSSLRNAHSFSGNNPIFSKISEAKKEEEKTDLSSLPHFDIIGNCLDGFQAIQPHYTSEEYGVTIRNLHDFSKEMDLSKVPSEYVQFPEYMSWRDERAFENNASVTVEVKIPERLTMYDTSSSLQKKEISYATFHGQFSLTQTVSDVLHKVKENFAVLDMPFKDNEEAYGRMILQMYGKQDFLLHKKLPIGYYDEILRCARMKESVVINIRLLTPEQAAALAPLITEEPDSYRMNYDQRYPTRIGDHYRMKREEANVSLKVRDKATGKHDSFKKFVLEKAQTKNHLKICVDTLRFPPILDLKSYVKVGLDITLVCGQDELLEAPLKVPLVTFMEQRDKSILVNCDAELNANFPVCDLPTETRVVIRLWGVDDKKKKEKSKAILLAGANTMLFNHNLNLSSVPFELDLTHIQRSSFEKDGTEGATAADASNRGSTGSGTTANSSSGGESDKSPSAAAIHEAFSNKNRHAVLLDDEGHEIPTFQALHLDACVPTAKDRQHIKRSTVNLGDSDGNLAGAGAEKRPSISQLNSSGKGKRMSMISRASMQYQQNRGSVMAGVDGAAAGGGALDSGDPLQHLMGMAKVNNLDESVLRVVESVQLTMHFRITKDKDLPKDYVITCQHTSLKVVLDKMTEEFDASKQGEDEDFNQEEFDEVQEMIDKEVGNVIDCLSAPSDREQMLLWKYRQECSAYPGLLPAFLKSVDWTCPADRAEAHHMLFLWRLGPPLESIQLLDQQYSDTVVREYAVHRLSKLSDEDLQTILLQLVQVLKYEPYHDSALARFLIRRALHSPLTVGHSIFWMLYSEMHLPIIEERFGLLLSLYLSKCGPYRESLSQQLFINNRLKEVAQDLKLQPSKKARLQYVRDTLPLINAIISKPFCTCLDPKTLCTSIISDKCKVMESKKMPLWVVFSNVEPGSDNFYTIFKDGDDLRQDQLTLQLISFMDRQWRDDHLLDAESISYSTLFGVETFETRRMLGREEARRSSILGVSGGSEKSLVSRTSTVASVEIALKNLELPPPPLDEGDEGDDDSGSEGGGGDSGNKAEEKDKEDEGETATSGSSPPPAPASEASSGEAEAGDAGAEGKEEAASAPLNTSLSTESETETDTSSVITTRLTGTELAAASGTTGEERKSTSPKQKAKQRRHSSILSVSSDATDDGRSSTLRESWAHSISERIQGWANARTSSQQSMKNDDGGASSKELKSPPKATAKQGGSGWGKLKGTLISGKLFTVNNDNRLNGMLDHCETLPIDLKMKPYGCVSTGYNTGMIQVVTDSKTLAGIQTEYGGKAMGAFSNTTMVDYLKENNETEEEYDIAVENFLLTCAGYCVCTYLLGIGDRHADNIMIQNSGHFFHIDFGHFLGNFKSKYGLNRERSPFVFTPEMAEVVKQRFLKKKDEGDYVYSDISMQNQLTEFECICIKAFNIIRQKAGLLMNLFLLMIPACMPELTARGDVAYLRHKLKFTLNDKEAAEKMITKISQCLGTTSRRIDNALHNLKHY